MLTSIDEAFARMMVLETAYTFIMGKELSTHSPALSEDFKLAFIDYLRKAVPSRQNLTPHGEQIEAAIRDRAVEIAGEFMEAVSEIEALHRAQPKQPPQG